MEQPSDLRQSKSSAPKTDKKQGPFYKRLHEMPQILGIVLMVVILLAAVYVGNWRTLNNLTSQAETVMQTQDMTDGIARRAAGASNMLTIASRYPDVSQERVQNVTNALAALKKGTNALTISSADQTLKTAMDVLYSELKQQEGFSKDSENAAAAMAQFAEGGNIMWQQARTYNRQIDHAKTIYKELPFRFLLPEPQEYKRP